MPQIVYTADATPTLPVFSQAVISRGHVYVSGTVGCIDDLKTLAPGGVQAETARIPPITKNDLRRILGLISICISAYLASQQQRVALQNMAKVLKAAGSGLEHIVKANIYLLHRDRGFDAMNEVYEEVWFNFFLLCSGKPRTDSPHSLPPVLQQGCDARTNVCGSRKPPDGSTGRNRLRRRNTFITYPDKFTQCFLLSL